MNEKQIIKKGDSRLRAVDLLILLLCLAGAAFCLWAFWVNLNNSLFKLNEEPIGTITWKNKAAQRRFSNRVLWDRLRKDSPVYNGDFIRTEDLSEATIAFTGLEKSVVNLEENSLVQIFLENNTARIHPETGSVGISAGAGGMVLIFNGKELTAAEGSGLRITADSATGLDIIISEGAVTYEGENGPVEARAGEALSFAAQETSAAGTAAAPLRIPKTAVFAPRQDAAFLGFGAPAPVEFSFNPIDYSGEITRLDISPSRNFSREIISRDLENHRGTAELSPGSWWWRAYPAQPGSSGGPSGKQAAAGKLTVLRVSPPSLLSPPDGQTFYFTGEKLPSVRFRWNTEAEGLTVADYAFEVADNPAFTNPRISLRTGNNGVAASLPGAETWYWRVTPFYPGGIAGTASQVFSFKIGERAGPAPPVPVSPANNKVIAPGEDVYLAWKGEEESWIVTISQNRDLSNPRVMKRTGASYYINKEDLENGAWYWNVRSDSRPDAASPVRSFTIGIVPPPAVPKPEPAVVEEPALLAAPAGLSPAPNYVFRPNRDNQSLAFSWNRVAGARSYRFRLLEPGGKPILSQNLSSPGFTLTNLTILSRGNFIWQVEAVDDKGVPGAAASRGFTVNMPEIIKQNLDEEAGVLYGN